MFAIRTERIKLLQWSNLAKGPACAKVLKRDHFESKRNAESGHYEQTLNNQRNYILLEAPVIFAQIHWEQGRGSQKGM
jgi:hypothetical protein